MLVDGGTIIPDKFEIMTKLNYSVLVKIIVIVVEILGAFKLYDLDEDGYITKQVRNTQIKLN